ncbi:YhdP family protein [Massilia polaris]|nr:YhdP family protein [Massilia polaris]
MANLASHHVLGFTIKLVLLVYFAFAIVFLFLRYAILPNIDYYKGDIERAASRALGSQVSIARIYASWRGLRPNFFLGDVTLRDAQGRQVLALPSVSATVSWWTVAAGDLRFQSLEIIRPELDVRRTANGQLYVAGVLLAEGPGDTDSGDWAFKQRQIVIREGRINWTDEKRGAPTLALSNVNMLLANRWTEHRFGLRATPPASLAQPIDIRAAFSHPRFARRIADPRQWKGELFADVRQTDLAGWKPYVDYPFQVNEGKGSVRAWLTLDRARLAGFTADIGLVDVNARLRTTLPPLALKRVSGRISASETIPRGAATGKPTFGVHGHTASLTGFSVETADGLVLPSTSISETFVPAQKDKPETVTVSARTLDLATLAAVGTQLPLTDTQRALLSDFGPRGRVENLSAQWQGQYPAISSYRIKARMVNLGMKAQAARLARPKTAVSPAVAAAPAIPGFDNLTGTIDASDKGGTISLDSQGTLLHLPAWFANPEMRFDRLDMKAHWTFEPQDLLRVGIDNMEFVQGALKGSLSGTHLRPLAGVPGKALGTVDIKGKLDGFDLNRIGDYLPLQTPPHLREWLVGALEGGTANDVALTLRGELSQFPFRANNAADRARGEFRVAGRIADGKLNYSPSLHAAGGVAPLWPQAERIDGSFLFDRARMEIRAERAATLGVALSNVKAVVADLALHDKMLEIDGSAAGPMQEFLRYVTASPVAGWIGHFTDDTRATGSAKLGLKLRLPLSHLPDTKVQGSLQLMNNEVVLFNDLPPVQASIGRIEFWERGVNLSGVGGSFVGGPLALSGGTQRDGAIVIRMGGSVSADGVRKTFPSAAMQRLAGHLSGSTRYTGAVEVRDHKVQVTVDSTLAGLGLDFPSPLRKAEADALPLHFSMAGATGGDGGISRDDIRISLGNAIAARYERQRQGREPWRVLRGGIGVNTPAPEPDSGLMINVSMKSLNVDQWIAISNSIGGPKTELAAPAASSGLNLSNYIIPDVMAARANELIIGDRKLAEVVVGASHQNDTWQASIDSRQVSGHVTWAESPTGQGLGKVTARLASLVIPESAAEDVKSLLEADRGAAASIPGLDIVAERFELFNKQLGRLELMASNAQAIAGREWRVNQLTLANPDGKLNGTGKWLTKDGKSSTSLNFVIDIADAGKLLDRFGFPETLRGGKGKLSGEIAWNGLPYALDIPTLSGQIELDVESGQFLKQDPGAAKLLGVLSLQALPRLLKLDFKDVFSEGLAFDGISADAIISKGLLRTDNLKMWGVAATVLMDGSADIANESTNLHVVVIPEFNLGTGPLVYALAVNPVIGIGSFLAQLFLRAPVMKALTYEMQITGPWKSPVIKRLGAPKPAVPAAPPKADKK